jgi:hypothetical protein
MNKLIFHSDNSGFSFLGTAGVKPSAAAGKDSFSFVSDQMKSLQK